MIASGDDIQRLMPLITEQKVVWLGSEYITDLFIKNLCPFIRSKGMFNSVNPLIKSDATAQEKIVGLPFTASFGAERTKRYRKMMTSLLELGIIVKTVELMEFSASPFTGSRPLMECLSNKIISHDHEFEPVNLTHYKLLLTITGWLLVAPMIVLIVEWRQHLYRRKRLASVEGSSSPSKSQRVTSAPPAARIIDSNHQPVAQGEVKSVSNQVGRMQQTCRRRSASHRIQTLGAHDSQNRAPFLRVARLMQHEALMHS
jgi:hypothetical protein